MSADHATPRRSPAWLANEPWHLAMPGGTLYDALARAAHARPSHPATVFYGASLSYAELRDRVDAMAGFLQSVCGVKRGDRVMIALQNSPKACMHTHRSALFTAVLQERWYGLDGSDVMTGFMPLFHVAGMQGSMNAAIVAGATLLLMARWDRDLLPDLFETYGVTFWNAAPTMIVDVLASASFRDKCFAKLKVLTGGGAAMPTAVAERLKGRFGLDFVEGYGMTETMSPTHLNPMAAPKRQCLGIAVQETDARVVDPESLLELDDNMVGEIVVHGPQVLQGYWNSPQGDAEAFIELDGKRFLRTGDLGYRDAGGYFFAVDRLKRMINVSGFKVWPAEVEAAMYQNRAIRECCIVSAPDGYRGETVKALVVLDEASRATTSADDIVDWARGAMASYKAPRAVVFVDSLPRTASNKINWRLLQDAEWGRTA